MANKGNYNMLILDELQKFRDKSISYAESNYAPMMVAESTATYGEKK